MVLIQLLDDWDGINILHRHLMYMYLNDDGLTILMFLLYSKDALTN